jgi:hypothetical protein
VKYNTDFRWIFKALGDILWPYKVVLKTTQEGQFREEKKDFFFYESGTHTGKMWKSAYPQKTLIYDESTFGVLECETRFVPTLLRKIAHKILYTILCVF